MNVNIFFILLFHGQMENVYSFDKWSSHLDFDVLNVFFPSIDGCMTLISYYSIVEDDHVYQVFKLKSNLLQMNRSC